MWGSWGPGNSNFWLTHKLNPWLTIGMNEHDPKETLRLCLSRCIEKAGSQADLARLLALSDNAISKWVKKGAVPVDRVPAVAEKLKMDRSEIRPDFWPPAEPVKAAA